MSEFGAPGGVESEIVFCDFPALEDMNCVRVSCAYLGRIHVEENEGKMNSEQLTFLGNQARGDLHSIATNLTRG
jgi:hypothetical protein